MNVFDDSYKTKHEIIQRVGKKYPLVKHIRAPDDRILAASAIATVKQKKFKKKYSSVYIFLFRVFIVVIKFSLPDKQFISSVNYTLRIVNCRKYYLLSVQ